MRYRENLPPVLRSVQIDMKAGEKVGVCGRTGAGKSTLFQSLFRLYEIDDDGGVIKIDGVDTRGIGLTPLRRGIAIIPQEPVLFVGSFRWNLDPFNEHSDQDIWAALSHAYLKDLVEKLPDKLESEITEGGGNMSVGQRQLLCLARAMLAKSRILVVDEATANVDMHTDRLIQTTIRSQFAGCTTLTIAHRLDTIIDSDRILVLDAGEVAEYDTPKALLSPGGGIGSFRALVDGTGPVEAKRLEDVAFGRVAFDDILEDPTAAAAKLSEVNSQTAVKQRLDKSAGLARENDVFRARDVLRRAIDDAVLARRSGETDDKAWLRQLRLMIDDMQEALEGKDEAVTKLAGQQLTD
jgi:ABC-type multidrug transport system ATPase subunit